MRVIAPLPRPAGELQAIPAIGATNRESVVVTWCREVATDIATSVGSPFANAEYLLQLYPHTLAPYSLYSSLLIAGRTVAISALWDDLWREPGFALAADGYRLGGQVTGAWNPDHSPTADPANWRACDVCGGTTRDLDPGRSAPRRPRPADLVTPWRYTSRPQPQGDQFNPAEWSVAVVDAHC